MTARRLGIPSSTTFDYEFAWLQHQLGCRAATRVVVPDAIPPERLARYGAVPPKLRRYPGLKEDYYLADLEPDPAVLDALGDRPGARRSSSCARHPTSRSTTGTRTRSSRRRCARSARDEDVHAIVLPRTDEQRDFVRSLGLPSVIVPEHAVDAQSLIAFADLVVSAGGTMNREAVALGVPVYTMFGGRLGGVDEAAHPRGPAAAAHRPGGDRAREARRHRPRASAATRRAARPAALRPRRLAAASAGEHLLAVALELRRARRPGPAASSPSVAGRRAAISASVALWKTT